MTVMWSIILVISVLVDTSLNMHIVNIFCMLMKLEIRTAAKSSLTAGLGIKVIPGGLTGKEDMHNMLHLLCNATEMKFDLLNEVEMYLLWCYSDIFF
jgi:hypothetical protein